VAFIYRGLSRESVCHFFSHSPVPARNYSCPHSYFILWLKEYASRYDQWVAQTRSIKNDSNSKEQYRFSNQIQHSTGLTLFYLRAKQTFFTPGAEYELNIPSDVLNPFHTGHFVSPHPDPIVFSDVAWQVHNMLKDSLDRFVLASYYNVGTNRALCGMIGGTVIALAGFVPPMAVNLAGDRERWLRLLALPGLWLGLTILVASLNGVRSISILMTTQVLILPNRFA
jgi:hypothetical protein